MAVERRTFLKGSAAVAGGALLGGPFQGLVAAPAAGLGAAGLPGAAGPPDQRDGKVRLHLPEGFRYRSFHDTEARSSSTTARCCPAATTGWPPSRARTDASRSCATTR